MLSVVSHCSGTQPDRCPFRGSILWPVDVLWAKCGSWQPPRQPLAEGLASCQARSRGGWSCLNNAVSSSPSLNSMTNLTNYPQVVLVTRETFGSKHVSWKRKSCVSLGVGPQASYAAPNRCPVMAGDTFTCYRLAMVALSPTSQKDLIAERDSSFN